MANKERNKRAARKARQEERKRLEAEHAASGHAPKADEAPKASRFKKESSGSAAAKPAKEKKPGKIKTYFSDVKTEMHQVTWPSRSELRNYSVAVIAMLIVFGVCLWAVDNGFVALIVAFTGLRG